MSYEELEKKFRELKERVENEILRLRRENQELKEQLKQKEQIITAIANILSNKQDITIENVETVYKIEKKTEERFLSTKTTLGQIMFVVINDFNGEPASESQIAKALEEHGWHMKHSTLAPNLGKLVKEGLLVREEGRPAKYRPPKNVKIILSNNPGVM